MPSDEWQVDDIVRIKPVGHAIAVPVIRLPVTGGVIFHFVGNAIPIAVGIQIVINSVTIGVIVLAVRYRVAVAILAIVGAEIIVGVVGIVVFIGSQNPVVVVIRVQIIGDVVMIVISADRATRAFGGCR